MRQALGRRGGDLAFAATLMGLTVLAVLPFWRTTLLPMQDYPQILVFARAFRDHTDPSSPFHGTYTTGYPLAPVVLPLLVLRALWLVVSLETAGKIVWSCYAIALPLAAWTLLRALGRDRWAVLLVFPLSMSYWVVGGFFAFATSAPLVLFGLALGLRWLERPSWPRGASFAALLAATFLWHALSFAQLVFDFGLLWLMWRAPAPKDRARALVPLAPATAMFAAWLVLSVRPASIARRPTAFDPLHEAPRFFEYIPPIVPEATACAMLFAGLLILSRLALPAEPPPPRIPFRVQNPFAWLSAVALLCFVAFPISTAGVEGIHNRQPWWAALLLVFAWSPPAAKAPRVTLRAILGLTGAAILLHFGARFAAFDRETAGASRLIDRLSPRQTLLAAVGKGPTQSFPDKPLIALDQYATIRHGGLPNISFAEYDVNFIRFVKDNPMPGLWTGYYSLWLRHPDLKRFDYVLLRGRTPEAARDRLEVEATDGDWTLAVVCGGRIRRWCR